MLGLPPALPLSRSRVWARNHSWKTERTAGGCQGRNRKSVLCHMQWGPGFRRKEKWKYLEQIVQEAEDSACCLPPSPSRHLWGSRGHLGEVGSAAIWISLGRAGQEGGGIRVQPQGPWEGAGNLPSICMLPYPLLFAQDLFSFCNFGGMKMFPNWSMVMVIQLNKFTRNHQTSKNKWKPKGRGGKSEMPIMSG